MENDDIPLPPMNPLIPFGEDTSPVPPTPTIKATTIPPVGVPEVEPTATPSQKLSQVFSLSQLFS